MKRVYAYTKFLTKVWKLFLTVSLISIEIIKYNGQFTILGWVVFLWTWDSQM